jgi:hypothetical protein
MSSKYEDKTQGVLPSWDDAQLPLSTVRDRALSYLSRLYNTPDSHLKKRRTNSLVSDHQSSTVTICPVISHKRRYDSLLKAPLNKAFRNWYEIGRKLLLISAMHISLLPMLPGSLSLAAPPLNAQTKEPPYITFGFGTSLSISRLYPSITISSR